MTKDDIISWAREAGVFVHKEVQPEIERFAALIAEREREECAMECVKVAHGWMRLGAWGENQQAHECAAAIRARGNT